MKEKTERVTKEHRWIAISGLLFVAAWVVGRLASVRRYALAMLS